MILSRSSLPCAVLGLLCWGCGTDDVKPPSKLPTLSVDDLPDLMSPEQIGSQRGRAQNFIGIWQGSGQFREVIDGTVRETSPIVQVRFGADGFPAHLAALGMVNLWRTYALPPSGGEPDWDGVAATLRTGHPSMLYAWCECEADGPANDVHLTPRSLEATADSLFWSYSARFRLVSMTGYELYDYESEDVRTEVVALERYRLESGRLRIEALAWTDGQGRDVSLSLDASLDRLSDPLAGRTCEFGCRLED